MRFPRFQRKAYLLLKIILIANLFFLFGTWLFHYYYYELIQMRWEEASGIKYLLRQLSLATENTLATWYSSMLFLLVAAMSLVCFIVERDGTRFKNVNYIKFGWLMFSLIFLILSFDEIASIHERLGDLALLNPLGEDPPGWVFLLGLPIAFIGVMMLLFCRMLIKNAPGAVGFAVVGILLFLSIPVQEYFEMAAWDAAPEKNTWRRPVQFLLIEEGSELLGVSLILLFTIIYLKRISLNLNIHEVVKEEFQKNKKVLLLSVGLGCILLFLPMVLSHSFPVEGENGIVKNWFPAATAFIGALFCCYLFFYKKEVSFYNKYTFILLAQFCLVLSAYYGGNIYSHFYHLQVQWIKILLVLLIFPAIVILTYRRMVTNRNLSVRLRIFIWSILLLVAIGLNNSYSAYIAYAGLSVLIYSLSIQYISSEREVEPTTIIRSAGN